MATILGPTLNNAESAVCHPEESRTKATSAAPTGVNQISVFE
jgi:hypothetical protein